MNAALEELRATRTYVVESEKFTALGRMVAGVAQEINTPLGIAVTMSSFLEKEVGGLERRIESGHFSKSDFETSRAKLDQGFSLLTGNLRKTADLVTSFKQLSADQSHSEVQVFRWDQLVNDLFLSLQHQFKNTLIGLAAPGNGGSGPGPP